MQDDNWDDAEEPKNDEQDAIGGIFINVKCEFLLIR